MKGDFLPEDFDRNEPFFYADKRTRPSPDVVDRLREIMKAQLNPEPVRQAREVLAKFEFPKTEGKHLYFMGEYLMGASTDGNPEVVYKMTPREYYCFTRGLEIYD